MFIKSAEIIKFFIHKKHCQKRKFWITLFHFSFIVDREFLQGDFFAFSDHFSKSASPFLEKRGWHFAHMWITPDSIFSAFHVKILISNRKTGATDVRKRSSFYHTSTEKDYQRTGSEDQWTKGNCRTPGGGNQPALSIETGIRGKRRLPGKIHFPDTGTYGCTRQHMRGVNVAYVQKRRVGDQYLPVPDQGIERTVRGIPERVCHKEAARFL